MRLQELDPPNEISLEDFCTAIAPSVSLIERALKGRLVIPNFETFEHLVDTKDLHRQYFSYEISLKLTHYRCINLFLYFFEGFLPK